MELGLVAKLNGNKQKRENPVDWLLSEMVISREKRRGEERENGYEA